MLPRCGSAPVNKQSWSVHNTTPKYTTENGILISEDISGIPRRGGDYVECQEWRLRRCAGHRRDRRGEGRGRGPLFLDLNREPSPRLDTNDGGCCNGAASAFHHVYRGVLKFHPSSLCGNALRNLGQGA